MKFLVPFVHRENNTRMSSYVPSKVFLRGVLLHLFLEGKSAAESHRELVGTYGDHALAGQTCRKWFARFRAGDFNLEDNERPGQPKKFEDSAIEALLEQDQTQTLEGMATILQVTPAAISKRLKKLKRKTKNGRTGGTAAAVK